MSPARPAPGRSPGRGTAWFVTECETAPAPCQLVHWGEPGRTPDEWSTRPPKASIGRDVQARDFRLFVGAVVDIEARGTLIVEAYERPAGHAFILAVDANDVPSGKMPFQVGDGIRVWRWTGAEGIKMLAERPRRRPKKTK